jgi:hypothetical protein
MTTVPHQHNVGSISIVLMNFIIQRTLVVYLQLQEKDLEKR